MDKYNITDVDSSFNIHNLSFACMECYINAEKGISINSSSEICGKRKKFREQSNEFDFYYCTDNSDSLSSNKVFRNKIELFKELIPSILDLKNNITQEQGKHNKRIFHNVVSLNAHNIQELYALVSDKDLYQKVEHQRQIIKDKIFNHLDQAASVFLRIAKNNLAIQTNINVFNKLSESNPNIKYRKNKINKVLLTVYHVFFQDFFDKNIQVIIENSDLEVEIDFESITVAFYHILDNASKYAASNSKINISFQENKINCKIVFEMTSIEILDTEVSLLTNEGFKGYYAKKLGCKSDGIGMYIINQLLKITNGKLIINRNINNNIESKNEINWCRNQIIIEIPIKYLQKYPIKKR